MQQFIQGETEKAKLQNAVHELNEKCWDLCVEGKPSNRLDRGQENCLRNCVERFLDSNLVLIKRFEAKAGQLAEAE